MYEPASFCLVWSLYWRAGLYGVTLAGAVGTVAGAAAPVAGGTDNPIGAGVAFGCADVLHRESNVFVSRSSPLGALLMLLK